MTLGFDTLLVLCENVCELGIGCLVTIGGADLILGNDPLGVFCFDFNVSGFGMLFLFNDLD